MPPRPPIKAFEAIMIGRRGFIVFFISAIINRIGAIFCHVIRIRFMVQFSLAATDGNHQWHGASPSFISRPERRVNVVKLFGRSICVERE